MNVEEWRPVVGHEGAYEISNWGRIKSTGRGGYHLKLVLQKQRGYYAVSLPGTPRADIHVLVAAAFIGPRPDGHYVCHNDGNPLNNHVDNLRYDTPAGNARDKRIHGTEYQANKTHCPQGHPYSPDNTYMYGNRRNCRVCARERDAAYRARRRAKRSEAA